MAYMLLYDIGEHGDALHALRFGTTIMLLVLLYS